MVGSVALVADSLPHDTVAETAVLGAVLSEPSAFALVRDTLRPEHFFESRHNLVFDAMREVDARGAAIDPVTLRDELLRRGKLEAVGGMEYLAALVDQVPTAAHVTHHAGIVTDKYERRALAIAAKKLLGASLDGVPMEKLRRDALALAKQGGRSVTGPARLAQKQQAEALARAAIDYSAAPKWPWPSLNELVGPLLAGDLWVVGARPACGKTTFLLNVVQHFTETRMPWLYIGMEMGPEQLRRKWAAFRLGFHAKSVLRNDWNALPDGAREAIDRDVIEQTTALADVAHFADARRVTPEQMAQWMDASARWGCKTVILDHIHQVKFGSEGTNLTHEMGEAVRAFKERAVKLGIVVIIAAQMNRPERELLADYVPPPLSALKQTGALEEVADVGIILHKALKRTATAADIKAVRQGTLDADLVIERNVMGVRCGKHRIDGEAIDRTAWLVVDRTGQLTERTTYQSEAA